MKDHIDQATAYKSFQAYECFLDKEVKRGNVRYDQARKLLDSARKNYKTLNLNRELDKCAK